VVITHDRWFLDRVATHILAFEGDGVVHWSEGGFSDYEAERRRRGLDEASPRGAYKPLARR
jgi:sulfate-transporting ATPase